MIRGPAKPPKKSDKTLEERMNRGPAKPPKKSDKTLEDRMIRAKKKANGGAMSVKKMRGGGMSAKPKPPGMQKGGEAMMDPPPKAKVPPKKMRGGGMAKKKAKPIKRGMGGRVGSGSRVRSSSKKPL